jgi:hypothetical protein
MDETADSWATLSHRRTRGRYYHQGRGSRNPLVEAAIATLELVDVHTVASSHPMQLAAEVVIAENPTKFKMSPG